MPSMMETRVLVVRVRDGKMTWFTCSRELERRTMDAILNSGPTETRARSRERLRGRVLSVDDAASLRTTRFER